MQNDGCTLIDCFAGAESAPTSSLAPRPSPLGPRPSPLVSRSGSRYQSHPTWGGTRRFESAETTRLNQAHWLYADDQSVNVWLAAQLSTIRSRATYEARQNPIMHGAIETLAGEIVGPNGPTVQVLSEDEDYNEAAEALWRWWFSAPTQRPDISGASWLKLKIRSLCKTGEYLDLVISDPMAEGPVQLRVRPLNPRRLATPPELAGDPNVLMGIRFNGLAQPTQYYIDQGPLGGLLQSSIAKYQPFPPDLVQHGFIIEEEDQVRGIPWLNTALPTAAELRDYDDQVLDASRQAADQSGMLFTRNPEGPTWSTPESMTVERRTWKMSPPGWEPFVYPASQPPVQYVDYRAERQRDIGRAIGMSLLSLRLDASKHSYAGARLDSQGDARTAAAVQQWLSGNQQNTGELSTLFRLILAEARFTVPALRNPPPKIEFVFTFTPRPHVDPAKEAAGEAISLQNLTLTLTDALAARGKNLDTQVETLKRELTLLRKKGLPIPAEWVKHPSTILAETLGAGEEQDAEAAMQNEE